ncbi:hypothetical protein EB796_022671 [Bugula neritina]|uniref:Uncharacterized protein n=1 Tax=Bugula neritina TaxID=10212 RepID=A0A7J7IZR8_BUGNE|nr:hypothetical protein EB796_022671 [Bugula neritina]
MATQHPPLPLREARQCSIPQPSAMLTSAGVSESAVTVTEAASHVGVVQVVKPINRSLTFSEPPIKRRLPDRPLSMRARKGSNSQSTRSRLPARSRTAASMAPPSSSVGAGNLSSEHHFTSQSRMPDHSTSKSPAIPAAIRASSPPNSPLRSEHAKSSTPRHSPPLSPHRKQRQPLSPRLASRSPSPPAASNTAIVRPQTAAMVQTTVVDEGTGLVAAGALSPIEMSAANPSHPIQRQTSTIKHDWNQWQW